MKTLKTLTFAAVPTAHKNPTVARRAKLIGHLEDQKHLANDPLHVRVVQRWVIQDNGVKAPVEIKKRVRPWWRADDAGALYLKVRYGARALEFEKGKHAILVKTRASSSPRSTRLLRRSRQANWTNSWLSKRARECQSQRHHASSCRVPSQT